MSVLVLSRPTLKSTATRHIDARRATRERERERDATRNNVDGDVDVTARDASGLTPVEERRAFGVRGLSEVADFIHSWRGKTDLKPRNVDEILKEETAIRDEISRLQSAVSQMSGQPAPASPEQRQGPGGGGSPPRVASRQREEYASARGLPPDASWCAPCLCPLAAPTIEPG